MRDGCRRCEEALVRSRHDQYAVHVCGAPAVREYVLVVRDSVLPVHQRRVGHVRQEPPCGVGLDIALHELRPNSREAAQMCYSKFGAATSKLRRTLYAPSSGTRNDTAVHTRASNDSPAQHAQRSPMRHTQNAEVHCMHQMQWSATASSRALLRQQRWATWLLHLKTSSEELQRHRPRRGTNCASCASDAVSPPQPPQCRPAPVLRASHPPEAQRPQCRNVAAAAAATLPRLPHARNLRMKRDITHARHGSPAWQSSNRLVYTSHAPNSEASVTSSTETSAVATWVSTTVVRPCAARASPGRTCVCAIVGAASACTGVAHIVMCRDIMHGRVRFVSLVLRHTARGHSRHGNDNTFCTAHVTAAGRGVRWAAGGIVQRGWRCAMRCVRISRHLCGQALRRA